MATTVNELVKPASSRAGRQDGKKAKGRRRKGISPWVPNQHGAWAMLVTPAILGLIAALITWTRDSGSSWQPAVVLPTVLIAWFFGYFSFFAFGLSARAKSGARRAQYNKPVLVYGGVAFAGLVVALLVQPQLLWWALPFAPLVGIAVWETLRGRSRSMTSGISTTIASALLIPVLVMVGGGAGSANITPLDVAPVVWASMIFIAIYFSGTIPFVKTMIREKGNPRYLIGSISYHAIAVPVVATVAAVSGVPALGAVLMVVTMVLACGRAVLIPWSARAGEPWTPKRVGMAEIPVLLVASVAVLVTMF